MGFAPKIAAVFAAIAETVFANPSLNFLNRPNIGKINGGSLRRARMTGESIRGHPRAPWARNYSALRASRPSWSFKRSRMPLMKRFASMLENCLERSIASLIETTGGMSFR